MSRTQLAAIFAASALAYLLSLNVYAKDAILCVPPPMPDNSGDVDALIMCINKANALGGGTIELSGLTYTLPSATFGLFTADGLNGLPDITSNITLKNGVITKDPSLEFRHLHISPPGSLSLKKITLENGNISGLGGGAIFVAAGAILGTVEYSSFINNMAVFTSAVVIPPGGGAIRVDGEFYLIKHSIFSSNQAFVSTGSGFIAGGAILLTRVGPANGGMIIDSIFVANAANGLSFDDANGGAIYLDNSTSLDSIIRSSFLGNSANHGGGAISVVSANLSTVDSSTFSFNTSQTTGAIDAGGSIGTISNSTFDHNLVASTFTVPIGGAIIIEDGASISTIYNCTFNQNAAAHSLIPHNVAKGGAIAIFGTIGQLFNSTIVGNQVGDTNGGAGIYNCGTIGSMISNIVADNLDTDTSPGTEDDVFMCDSGIISIASFNLIGIDTNTSRAFDNVGDNTGNIVGTSIPINPNVGVLKDNGGPTETMALLPNSPAIGAGANPLGLAHDQRDEGFRRMVHALTDIGAFEVQEPPVCPCPPGRHCRPDDCPH